MRSPRSRRPFGIKIELRRRTAVDSPRSVRGRARVSAGSLWPYAITLCAAALVAGAYLAGTPRAFPLDDAYIHLAYGKSLALTGALGLNPGEPSLGTSSPLWALCLVPLFWLQNDPFATVHALTLAATAGYLVLGVNLLHGVLGALSLSARGRRIFAALGGVLLATNGSLGWMALSGMETSLVLLLCAAAIHAYVRRGPGLVTGILFGLCLLCRTTTVALLGAVLLTELLDPRARRRRAMAHLLASAALTYAPYAVHSWRLGHALVPNTAKGKLLTYVSSGMQLDEWLHFWGRTLALHKYLPVFALFGVAMIAALWLRRRHGVRASVGVAIGRHPASRAVFVLALWSVLHLAQYTLAFRTIGQQGRYLAEWLFALTVVGVFASAYCTCVLRRRSVTLAIVATLGLAQLVVLPYWCSVYRNNVNHVMSAYVAMARWVDENTEPGARIASFDIGVVRYVGQRHTIDLGGLVDPSTHPCLVKRSCAEYVRAQRADYVMYPKDPESDRITGVQQAEFAPRWLLRESFVAQFEAHDYAAPTLTHSFRLQLFHVDGWFDRDVPGRALRAFQRDTTVLAERSFASGSGSEPDFEIVGSRIDTTHIRYVREYPYDVTLWLAYRALRPLQVPKWLHVVLYDESERRTVHALDVALTDAVLLPEEFPIGEVLQEHRVFQLPELRAGRYQVRVHVSEQPYADQRYPSLYRWLDVGQVDVARSQTTALAPL